MQTLTFSKPRDSQDILDYLRDNLQKDIHEGQWRDCWLNVMAWSMGFERKTERDGRDFVRRLLLLEWETIAVIDGLEDLFQNLASEQNQQIALRSLLQDVPEWLEQQPGRPLGLLVFIRRDMVLNAIKQNAAQLIARYDPYALKWDAEQSLRLVAWIISKAPLDFTIENLEVMPKADLIDKLVPLWGRKLGSERSREARSAAWVIAALSDFNEQIQARDLVRFLAEAAQASIDNTYWKDRLLVPAAIRSAIKICSQEKIKEIKIENSRLGNVLDKLNNLSDEHKLIPFTREAVNLEVGDMKTLEDNGVVLRKGEEYYMPEIFRLRLNFKWLVGARPPVLTFSRQLGK